MPDNTAAGPTGSPLPQQIPTDHTPATPDPAEAHDDATCPEWCLPDMLTPGTDERHVSDWNGITRDDGTTALVRVEIGPAGPRLALVTYEPITDRETVVRLSIREAHDLSAEIDGAAREAIHTETSARDRSQRSPRAGGDSGRG